MTIKIAEIKEKLDALQPAQIPEAIMLYQSDQRKSVIKLLENATKRHERHLKEQARLWEISSYERECYSQGAVLVGGIDEVGRGPLAGPVVAAVVVLKKGAVIEGVNDSKKLSESKREELYEIIIKQAEAYGVGIVSPQEIDQINILQATYKAMGQAISNLKEKPDFLLVDAVTIPNIDIKQKGIIKGDAKSISIGSASIVAKVVRDRMMVEYSKLYPGYDFEGNKGYGSPKHIAAIKEIGICPIHRRSFVKNFI